MAKNKKKFEDIEGIPIESVGEQYFLYWCLELKENGYIKNVLRGKSYLLCEALVNSYFVQLKTKSKSMTETILMPHTYTSDFIIEWTEKGKELFCNKFGEKWVKYFICNNSLITHIENKPSEFDFNNMERLAKVNIKFVWDKYKDFIQIVKNDDLFKSTFTPKKIIYKKNGEERARKFKVKTLEEFIEQQTVDTNIEVTA